MKGMKKWLSGLLAAVVVLTSVPLGQVQASEATTPEVQSATMESKLSQVESITAEDIRIMEYTNGYYTKDYNPETREYDLEWYRYSFSPTFTVTYKDGRVETGSWNITIDGQAFRVLYSDNQSYENQWGVGKHTVTATIEEIVVTFTVEIVESPIESIAVEDVSIIEYTNGYYTTAYNSNTGKYDLEWYKYNSFSPTVIVTYKDGRVTTGKGMVDINGVWHSLSYVDDQSYENQWGVGKHTVTARIAGKEATFTVEIVESPIENITVEDMSVIEYTHGYYTSDWNSDLEWYRYDIFNSLRPTFTVTYKNGHVVTGNGSIEINGEWYSPSYEDDQSYENQWNIGKHTVTARLAGKETTFTVEVVESPIEGISVENMSITEFTNGGYTKDWNSDLEWYRYNYSPTFTVTYKDGHVITKKGSIDINGKSYFPSYVDDQSSTKPWGVGKHTVIAMLAGRKTTFTVEITESPYVTLEVLKMLPVIENQNCKVDKSGNVIYDIPVFSYKLTAKDGSYITGMYDPDYWTTKVVQNEGLRVFNTQTEKPWTVGGDNSFVIKYGDLEVEVPVELQKTSDFEYIEQNGGLYITDCHLKDETIEIPETINGKTVVGIVSLGSEVDSMKSLVIPDTVKSIGTEVFYSWDASVETIYIGSGVTYLDADMFGKCSKLKSITISENNPDYCDIDGVVYDKTKKTLIYYPVGKGEDYTVPATVTNIDILNADIYRNLNITFEEGSTAYVTEDGVTYNVDKTKVIFCNPSKTGAYVMPDTVTEITEGAFKESNLTDVKISNNVTEITYEAFANCTSLSSVELPTNLKLINDRAFYRSALTEVTIPNSVVEVGNFAFYWNGSLKKVTIPNSVIKIGNQAFCESALTEVTIPDSVIEIGNSAFAWTPINKLDLGQGVKSIGEGAFCKTSISSLIIPESVTNIGDGVFEWCENLKKVDFKNKNISIGESLFAGCPIEEVNLENVKGKIDRWAFNGSKLTSLNLPDGVTEIAYAAFLYSTELATIDVPESLVRISGQAFDNTAWEKAQKDGPVYLEHIFYGYKGNMPVNKDLVIKDGTTVLADFALMQYDELSSVTLPEGLKTIGSATFWGDSNIKEIRIPASVSFIGKAAFAGCYSLESIDVDPANEYYSSVDGVLFNKDKTELIWCPKRAGNTYEVPSTVTLIKEGALGESDVENIKIRNENVVLEKYSLNYKYNSFFYGEPEYYRYNYVILHCVEGSTAYKYAMDSLLGINLLVLITDVTLDQTQVDLVKGNNTTLTATINPDDTTDGKSLRWASSDESVVRIGKETTNGVEIEAVGAGTATITVTTENGKTASCVVTVRVPITGVTLDQTQVDLVKGNNTTLTATINPSDTTDDKILNWTSSDESVVRIGKETANGVEIEAVGAGTATITVTTVNGKTASCVVTVRVPITSVNLDQIQVDLVKGNNTTLTATINPDDTTDDKILNWTSSNESVVRIGKETTNGVEIEAVGAGTATITVTTINGKTASCVIKVAQWVRDGKGWWYQRADGTYPANCWKEISDVWYYFNASGYMVTGWQSIGGTWYYLSGSGAMQTGWQLIGGAWYYLDENGAMVTGWQLIDDTWYYLSGSGAMLTGWQALGGTWYYLNGSGAMLTGWQAIGGTWYYFNENGAMLTGWQLIGDTWYYLNASGAMVANQWVGNYYLQADGSMATNKWIDNYYVDANGVWDPNK